MNLIVIAKEPRPGFAKTRLSPPCTDVQAAAIARAALADTLSAVASVGGALAAVALDGRPGRWLPEGIAVVPQRGVGLAERLAAAFEDVGGPAFLIGMDTPQVTAGVLTPALEQLGSSGIDAVLGAADDGGWWGIGLREPDPEVFRRIPMSSPGTVDAQRARLRQLGLRWTELGTLRDVDTFEDAVAVAEVAPRTRFAVEVARVRQAATVGMGR